MNLVDERRLYGRGLGWIDAHLIASALLSEVKLWSFSQVADELGMSFSH